MSSTSTIPVFRTRGVSQCGLAIYTKKYLKAKRRIMETQIFHHAKNIIFKRSSKKNQKILQNIFHDTKFQHKPKISSFKNPHIKILDLLLLPRGQNPLNLPYSIMNLNTISLLTKARPTTNQTGPRLHSRNKTP